MTHAVLPTYAGNTAQFETRNGMAHRDAFGWHVPFSQWMNALYGKWWADIIVDQSQCALRVAMAVGPGRLLPNQEYWGA